MRRPVFSVRSEGERGAYVRPQRRAHTVNPRVGGSRVAVALAGLRRRDWTEPRARERCVVNECSMSKDKYLRENKKTRDPAHATCDRGHRYGPRRCRCRCAVERSGTVHHEHVENDGRAFIRFWHSPFPILIHY